MRLPTRVVYWFAAIAICFSLAATSTSMAGTLIVLNKSGASATLIDDESGTVVATIPTGDFPHEVAVSPDGRLAVGTNYGNREAPGSSLTVIDIPSAEVIKTIDLGDYRRPHGVAWLSDGKHVAVTAEGNKALLKVDVETGKVVSAVETGQDVSHMLAVTPDGKRAFVANIGSGTTTAIDLAEGRKLADITTGDGAEGIDITPNGRHVWVTNRAADTVSVIDAATLEVVATVESKEFPIRSKITPNGKRVLVSCARSGNIAVFDTETHKEIRRIEMKEVAKTTDGRLFGDQFGESSVPIGIVIRPDGKRAWVAHTNADKISVIDLENWQVSATLIAGEEPDGLAYSELEVQK